MKSAGAILPALPGLEFFLPPVSQRKTKVIFDISVVFKVKMTVRRINIRTTTPGCTRNTGNMLFFSHIIGFYCDVQCIIMFPLHTN
jgi:hypothetical protein